MILLWILIITFAAGLLAWFFSRWSVSACRWLSLSALILDLILLINLWIHSSSLIVSTQSHEWLSELNWNWIPQLGIGFHLAADGLSLLFLVLTAFLGIMSVAASWTEVKDRPGFFHFNLMLALTGVMGVFISLDLFLFYFFWELMLVPVYFLISVWGHENRFYAAIKFFIFTQAGGLLMLLSILGLYFVHAKNTGSYTFDYTQLLGTSMLQSVAFWLMLGFFAGFAVKIPAVPFHSWLPDAYTEAPTAGTVILAGLMSKTGAYGLLRFLLPLFPQSAQNFSEVVEVLGVIGILYGAILAFGQKDIKRLIAYSSISHLGFVLLGIFVDSTIALQGVVIIILAHGLSIAGLFIVAGVLQERIHSRDMDLMGGLWSVVPRMGGVAMFFVLASLGLPGLANFIGEFLVLVGSYRTNPALTAIAAVGMITSAVYSLWLIFRCFHGEVSQQRQIPDLNVREIIVFTVIIIPIVWLGVYPQTVLNTSASAVEIIQRFAKALY
jgi:NADH-quinone oxidoreductase subunit M